MAPGRLPALICSLLIVAAHAYPQPVSSLASVDPCAAIAGKTWASPAEVRACFTSFPVNQTEKANIIEVITKTLAFHASVNYQRQAPTPFARDVHTDVLADLARIGQQDYASDFDLHLDVSLALRKLNDNHCVYINQCYDSLFITYLPIPLVLLADASGEQHVHIAPEAFVVANAEFPDQIQTWQNALQTSLSGGLEALSGARVLSIDGEDPFVAVNANAETAGGFQALGTRQNAFFSSYSVAATGWTYLFGQFAEQSLPLKDSVTLTIQRVNGTAPETITLPYRSRIGSTAIKWTDSASFRARNCRATVSTNGFDLYGTLPPGTETNPHPAAQAFRQAPQISIEESRKHRLNAALNALVQPSHALPKALIPRSPIAPYSNGAMQFFMLEDGRTGVLALGSFASTTFAVMQVSLLSGLKQLKGAGATRLIIDITNNSGGYICIANWLHRILAGAKPTTVPQAGLDTVTRAGPLAQLIVKQIASSGVDRFNLLYYNSLNWRFANATQMPADADWMSPPVQKTINGFDDAFSQRIGEECQPWASEPDPEPLFDSVQVAIVSNGRCASSCALFSITMAKLEGARMVVVGGKRDVPQQYCGTVGGQSLDFVDVDTEIKTAKLKAHPLAPPNFMTNSVQGITWRLSLGVDQADEPEEWQDHPATVNLPLTTETVNNPQAIWQQVARDVL